MRFAPQLLAVVALGVVACGEPAAPPEPAPVQVGPDGLPLGHLPIPRAPRVPGSCSADHVGTVVEARLEQDGAASSRSAGDPAGVAPATVLAGAGADRVLVPAPAPATSPDPAD